MGVTLRSVAAAGVAAAVGCGAPGGGPTLEFWALGREGELVTALLPGFEARNPGVRVRVQQIPWSAAHEKLLTAHAGGSLPDVLQLGNTWIPEFVALRAVAPLDERLARSRSIDAADYFPGILETNVLDGAVWGIPWYVDTRVLFYRSDLLARAGFARAPRTWEAWREAMERVRRVVGPRHHAILLPLQEWELPVILALQLHAELLRDGNRYGSFRDPRFRRALAWYVDLFRDGLAPVAGPAQLGNLYRDFAEGHFAMFVSGPWNLGELASRLPPALEAAWATAPLPAPDGEPPGLSLAGGASLALARSSAHPDEAWRLVEYLSESRQQLAFYRLGGDLPSRRSAWLEGALAADPRAGAFHAQLEALAQVPKIPEWERIASRVTRHAEAVVRGERSLDAALAALDRDADAILEKRRWLLDRRPAAGAALLP